MSTDVDDLRCNVNISKLVQYHNFGYIPTGNRKLDVVRWLFGHPNILKRLQAKQIMKHLNTEPGDFVLDYGCGAGFFTVEIAKTVKSAYGLDISPYISSIQVPAELQDRLKYQVLDVDDNRTKQVLPFKSNTFDKVLISDVYVTLVDPQWVTEELYRILKSDGKLVIVNTLGRPQIQDAYKSRSLWFQGLSKLFPKFPETYEQYVHLFFYYDKLKKTRWDTLEELTNIVTKAGFKQVTHIYPFNRVSIGLCYWWQFIKICRGKGMSIGFNPLVYYLLQLLGCIITSKDRSNVVIIASKGAIVTNDEL